MAREYCACWVRVDQRDWYVIWFSGDYDGIYTSEGNMIPSFASLAELRSFAAARGIHVVDEEPLLNDFDALRDWTAADDPQDTDPKVVLSGWNLLADSLGKPPDGLLDDYHLYMKILTANNLPIFTPPGEEYHPTFTRAELADLKRVLARHLKGFTRRLAVVKEC